MQPGLIPEGLKLYPFQEEDVRAWLALKSPRFLWQCNDMGLGKTVDAVICGKACGYSRILVVTMASVRPEWTSAFKLWWPERPAPAEIDRGFARKAMSRPEVLRMQAALENPTHIVSTELLPKLIELHKQEAALAPGEYRTLFPYDYIVIDELHEIRSWWSKAFQALWTLRSLYPLADWKPLSGTPLGADPLRMWPWLKLSEPMKWGNLRKNEEIPFNFRKMYGEKQVSEYAYSGFKYEGINQETLPLYKKGVAHLFRRKTKSEVGFQLPPMRFEVKRFPMNISPEVAAADWIEQALASEVVACFAHNHVPMDAIQAVLDERKVPYVRLYDEHSPEERRALVEQAEREHKAILSTTGLVSTGVNYLANIHTWMLAQPSENPVEIQQLATRFTRLSSKDKTPRVGYLLYREGEEFSAQQNLLKRLQTNKEIVLPAAEAAELERLIEGKSSQNLLAAVRLLGRSLAAFGDDDPEDEDEAA